MAALLPLVLRTLPVALALCCSGCLMLASDGDKLRREAQNRDLRLEHLEAQANKNQADVDQKLAELQQVLDRATGGASGG